jgi:hypothetical protein
MVQLPLLQRQLPLLQEEVSLQHFSPFLYLSYLLQLELLELQRR